MLRPFFHSLAVRPIVAMSVHKMHMRLSYTVYARSIFPVLLLLI